MRIFHAGEWKLPIFYDDMLHLSSHQVSQDTTMPLEVTQAINIIDSPPCFTVGMVFLLLAFFLEILQ